MEKTKRKSKLNTGDLIFYCCMLAFPVLQFVLFYIATKSNAILFAFQGFDIVTGRATWTVEYVVKAFNLIVSDSAMLSTLKMSFLSYAIVTFIGTPLGLLFSFYISKKMPGHGLFRVLLFLPSIISAIVLVVIFQYFVDRAIPSFVSMVFGTQMKGLLENVDTRYWTVMFYNLWIGFGVSVLMYSDAISAITPDVVEASHIDGVNALQEFWYITLPGVFPTLTTFMVTSVAGIFTNQFNLFTFYGGNAPEGLITYGYYFFNKTQSAQSIAEYPLLSAMGLWITLVCVPLTFLVKWAMEKFGPKED